MSFVKSSFSFIVFLFFMFVFSGNASAQSCCSSTTDTTKAHQHKMMKSKMESTKHEHDSDSTESHQHKMMKCMSGSMKHDHSSDSTKTEEASFIWNKYCPVLGNEVDPEVETVDYNGKKVGFCCASCIKKFNKEPERYLKNLSEDGSEFIAKK